MAHHLMRFDPLAGLACLDPVASSADFMRHLHLKYTLREGDAAAPIGLDVFETAHAYMVKATMTLPKRAHRGGAKQLDIT